MEARVRGESVASPGARKALWLLALLTLRAGKEIAEQAVQATAGKVVIGESMSRVQRYADEIGAETFGGRTLADNEAWIRSQMDAGKTIIDIGPDFSRRMTRTLKGATPSSPFYNMERMVTAGYPGYTKAFERTGKLSGGVPRLDF